MVRPARVDRALGLSSALHKAQEKDKAVKVILNKKINNQNKFSGKVKSQFSSKAEFLP
jgi:hypothetical protein